MNITFENADKVNGLMTITVEENDFKEAVEKTLKDYRKKANVPGFRPGQVPMGMIKRMYGTAVKMDAINRVVGQEMYKYVKDNNIQMLGEPLPHEGNEAVDIEKPAPYTFQFDLAVAPEINVKLSGHDKIDYLTIDVDDKLIDQQVRMYASRGGSYQKADDYQDNDMLKGDLRELDKENGIELSEALVMPTYIKDEDQKKLFEGSKLGDIITFNPRKAYQSDAELASLLKVDKADLGFHTGDFTYQITEISRFTPAEVNQELFDQVYGKDAVKDEKEFRERVAEEIKAQLQQNSDWKFLQDLRAHCEKKAGKLTWPDELLKRIMKQNNPDKGDDYVEKNYEGSVKELTWHLIKEQLVSANDIKISDDEVKAAAREAARAQFAQYGMSNVPDEYLDNYAQDMLKKEENVQGFVDRAIDQKLIEVMKNVVKLNEKTVSLDEFNKAMAE
ncbi:MAG: trigger factor [Prevotella sp.]|jgi:trigger factor|nr:trigger factor [Prevotella sp.]MBQ6194716.1 trigger factor [Prevotella sp.]MBR0269023.1 trigger factor [Prevotella sp.]